MTVEILDSARLATYRDPPTSDGPARRCDQNAAISSMLIPKAPFVVEPHRRVLMRLPLTRLAVDDRENLLWLKSIEALGWSDPGEMAMHAPLVARRIYPVAAGIARQGDHQVDRRDVGYRHADLWLRSADRRGAATAPRRLPGRYRPGSSTAIAERGQRRR